MRAASRSILLLHGDDVFADRLARAVAGLHPVVRLSGWAALRAALQRAPPGSRVVVDPFHASRSGDPAADLQELLRAFPGAIVIGAVSYRPSGYQHALTLGVWGLAQLIQIEEESSRAALRHRLSNARTIRMHTFLASTLPELLSLRGQAIVETALRVAEQGGTVADLARLSGRSMPTLARWCREDRLPNPRYLLVWIRALIAAEMLDGAGHTVLSIALSCGYGSDEALRRMLRQTTGLPPRALRRQGAFLRVSDRFERLLREASGTAPRPVLVP